MSLIFSLIRILLSAREDIKYSPRVITLLIGMQIADMKLLDEHLAKVSQNTHLRKYTHVNVCFKNIEVASDIV